MIYKINHFDELIIYNDSYKQIFVMDNDNDWIKNDYGHNGKYIYYEDDSGRKRNYDI